MAPPVLFCSIPWPGAMGDAPGEVMELCSPCWSSARLCTQRWVAVVTCWTQKGFLSLLVNHSLGKRCSPWAKLGPAPCLPRGMLIPCSSWQEGDWSNTVFVFTQSFSLLPSLAGVMCSSLDVSGGSGLLTQSNQTGGALIEQKSSQQMLSYSREDFGPIGYHLIIAICLRMPICCFSLP